MMGRPSEHHAQRGAGFERTLPELSRARSREALAGESAAISEEDASDSPASVVSPTTDPNRETTWPRHVRYLLLVCAFITSLSFGVTQVPMLYVFRLMTCDAYYEEHGTPGSITRMSQFIATLPSQWLYPSMVKSEPEQDRCSISAIESATSLSFGLLGASTTFFGIANLFIAGHLIKRMGVRATLFIQVFFPALRLAIQNIGVEVWGNNGMIIIQCSQVVNLLGGPSGYLLALNTFTTEVVEYEERTAALGRLTGSQMFGSALGFLLGGIVADMFGNAAPFRLTLLLFMVASVYVVTVLPYIPPAEPKTTLEGSSQDKKRRGPRGLLAPLAVFSPRKFIGVDGVVRTEYGAFLLAWGVFLGILATGYLQVLLQMYATDVFGFGTTENGWLTFMFSILRGCFLTFIFPHIISVGRRLTTTSKEQPALDDNRAERGPSERDPLLPAARSAQAKTGKEKQTFTFDLTYTRFSLCVDGLMTLFCSFVREGWQMYLMAVLLPFGSGTGSAAKGTILQMLGSSAGSSERTDALAGVSLIENMARLSTTFVFGVIFAAFATLERLDLVFVCNAAFALVGFTILLFAQFPPEGSQRLDESDENNETLGS